MDVMLSKERIDVQDCQVLVIGFFTNERPLKGSSGWIDWRLNGTLSRFLIQKKLTGEWKETTLIPSQGRVFARMILLVGLGKIKEYSYLRVRDLSPYLLETLKKLDAQSVCLSLPYQGNTCVDCGKLAEVLIEGMADCIDLHGYPFDEEWIKNLQIYFAEGEKRFYEVLLGIQTAQSILEERIKIRILVSSEDHSAQGSEIQI